MFTVTSSSAGLCFSGRGATLLILHTPAERRIDSSCQLAAAAERVVSTATVVTVVVHVTGVVGHPLPPPHHHHRGVHGRTDQPIDFTGAFWVTTEINRLVLFWKTNHESTPESCWEHQSASSSSSSSSSLLQLLPLRLMPRYSWNKLPQRQSRSGGNAAVFQLYLLLLCFPVSSLS